MLSAAFTAVVFGALKNVFGVVAIPTCTLPFCIVASCFHQLHRGVDGLKLAEVGSERVGAWLKQPELPGWIRRALSGQRRRSTLKRWDKIKQAARRGSFRRFSFNVDSSSREPPSSEMYEMAEAP